jgi:hypothetical protein
MSTTATAAIFIALLLSLYTLLTDADTLFDYKRTTLSIVSTIVSVLAALLTVITFIIDLALFGYVRNKMRDLEGVNERTKLGGGVVLTLFATLLILLHVIPQPRDARGRRAW